MAFAPERTFAAQAVVGGRTHLRPNRAVLGNAGQLGQVAALGLAGPGQDALEMPGGVAAGEGLGLGLLQAELAQVIGAAFQQRRMHRRAERLLDARQVAVVQLFLQGLGAGGDDHPLARQQRRHQVSEGLAGAGAGFGDQHRAVFDGFGDFGRQLLLALAEREALESARQHAVGRQRVRAGVDQLGGHRRAGGTSVHSPRFCASS